MTTKLHITMAASAVAMLLAGAALAQTPPPAVSGGTTGSIEKADPAMEAKWKALDKDGKGYIDGAGLQAFKPVMTQIDTNGDGKLSKEEFMAAAKAGIIK